MAQVKPFAPAKLVIGVIYSEERYGTGAEERLVSLYGAVDLKSSAFPFNTTDYYERQMGKNLHRLFLSFTTLIPPDSLSEIKARTNSLEEELREAFSGKARLVNLDPGILTRSALIMATAKDFAHRVPLQRGIYGHLEILFTKTAVRLLPWTYPDFRQQGYQNFLLEARRIYLMQLRGLERWDRRAEG
ncbi:MAG: DUF4416 family protein [Candidatus Aminicenantes bacterium]|nr:DUF4416 family protein [Candidatus Aminicenantes bacterium]